MKGSQSDDIARQAGSALIWKGIQLASTKGIFLVRTLILARLLVPEDFGLLAIATVAVGFLLTITDFGMIPALVQRADANERHYDSAWTVGVLRALAITVIVAVAAPIIATLFAEPRAAGIIRVLALVPVLEAAASIKVAELTKNLRFRSLALARLPDSLVDSVVSIALARQLGVWALVAGALSGSATYAIMSYILAPYWPRLRLARAAASSLIHFGRWIFMIGLIAMVANFNLQLAVARSLGAAELGLYVLSAKLAFLPAEVASEVVGTVAFPVYARLQSDVRQATRAFQAILTGMAVVLVPVGALIIALAPSLVADVLGPRWEGSVPVIRLLVCASIIGLFGESIVPILKGVGQPYKVVVIELAQSGLLLSLVWVLASRFGVIGAALAWLPAVIVSQLISAGFVRKILDRPFAGLMRPVAAIAATSVAGAAIAVGVGSIAPGLLGLVLAGCLSLPTMGLLLWALDRRFDLGLAADLPRVFPQVARLVGLTAVDA